MLLFPLVCFIGLFVHKIIRKEDSGEATLKLTDLLENYMFAQNQVMLCGRIGKSVFGVVFKGYAHKILPHENETLVAIKVVKGSLSDAASVGESEKVDFAKLICITTKWGQYFSKSPFTHIYFTRCFYRWDRN